MNRLHIYTVHLNPSDPRPYEKAEFVKDGFNWTAFFFTWMYLFYKRLWFPAFCVVIAFVFTLGAMERGWLHPESVSIINLGIQVIIGFSVNDWIMARLKKKGYIVADLVSGENSMRAEQRFFDRFAATHQLLPT